MIYFHFFYPAEPGANPTIFFNLQLQRCSRQERFFIGGKKIILILKRAMLLVAL
jgi:hypothetical protein